MTDAARLFGQMPEGWRAVLGEAASPDALARIASGIAEVGSGEAVLPAPDRVFAALEATPYRSVRAVILGQDPYPRRERATGLAFSVPDESRPLPISLQRIRRELHSDRGVAIPEGGSLEQWTRNGILLLNTILTVREGEPGSHRKVGWQTLTDAIIRALCRRDEPVAFLLWGRIAQRKAEMIDDLRHVVVCVPHPASRSHDGFIGSRPFGQADDELRARNTPPIDWSLERS